MITKHGLAPGQYWIVKAGEVVVGTVSWGVVVSAPPHGICIARGPDWIKYSLSHPEIRPGALVHEDCFEWTESFPDKEAAAAAAAREFLGAVAWLESRLGRSLA